MHDRSRGLWVALAALGCTAVATPAAAHVEYTAEGSADTAPLELFIEVVTDPLHAALLAGGAAGVAAVAVAYLRRRPFARDVAVFRAAVSEYDDLLPWLLRLSFGLPLVGAGFAGYFISPSVRPAGAELAAASRLFQIALGFALLFGLATRAAAGVGLATYLGVATVRPELLLALEYVPGLAAVVLVGGGRPSADQVLEAVATAEGTVYGRVDPVHRFATWFRDRIGAYRTFAPTVIRVGLGATFVLLGLGEKLLAPGPALNVVSKYGLTRVVPVDPGLWVVGAGLTEVALGLALIAGVFTRAGSLTALGLFTTTLFGLPDDPVLAHITLFGLASALIITGAGPLSLDRRLEAGSGADTADPSDLPDEVGLAGD